MPNVRDRKDAGAPLVGDDAMSLVKWKRFFVLTMTAYVVIYLGVLFADIKPLSNYGDVIELVGILLSLFAFAVCIQYIRREYRPPWICFALTALCSLIGEGLWSYFTHVSGAEPEPPSVCDAFYLLCFVACIIGIVSFSLKNRRINVTNFSLDLLISFVASAGLIYIFFILPILKDVSLSTAALAVQISYPICDLVILFGSLILFFTADRVSFFRMSLILMQISFLTIFCADQLNLLEELYNFDSIKYVEPLWPLAYCTLSFAGILYCEEIDDIDESVHHISPFREKVFEVSRLLISYIITFSILMFVCIEYKLYNFIFAWAMLLIAILSIRQIFILLYNKRLYNELQTLNLKITHDAHVDFLTQLSNRRYINDVFEQLAAKDDGEPLGLMLIDVDCFKNINDTHGHQVGDQVLRGIADTIGDVVRGSDIAGRFGGDEFIILLPGADAAAVRRVGERLMQRIRSDGELARLHVTLSVGGVSWSPTNGKCNVGELLKEADRALYCAKEGGRDRLIISEVAAEMTA